MKNCVCILKKLMLGIGLACLFLAGCKTEVAENKTFPEKEPDPPVQSVISNSFFWGTWVRMDKGTSIEVYETTVKSGSSSYRIEASTQNSLTVASMGTFEKQSDSVIVNNNIPYFRNGGSNLEYSLKLVGFTGSSSRAAGSSIAGIKGKAKSDKYTSFEKESTSDSDGTITFTAPTKDDTQTVTILNGDDMVVVPGLTISNSGDYMGTVALVGKDDYNLKITGTISDDQKNDGYLYGNNAKEYDLTITITNISENSCRSSVCEIIPDDYGIRLQTSTGYSSFTISTLKAGATRVENCKISYGEITEPYIDTGITIKIKNSASNQEWIDYVPLRFYKGLIPMTVEAKSPEKNDSAALNGFIIYPDGNNQFFSVPNNESKILFVPTFGERQKYTMIFSGATVTSELSDSTEMFYSVSPASSVKRDVITHSNNSSELLGYMNFGGDNHKEEDAYDVTGSFQAYLSEGEIDYYTITADGEEYYAPGAKSFCQVTYESEYDTVPTGFYIPEDSVLSAEKLPVLEHKGMTFLGWYAGNTKVSEGYKVTSSIKLTAKWEITSYKIEYVLYGGTNAALNQTVYTILSEKVTLLAPSKNGYCFEGWYSSEDFSGNEVITIETGSTGDIKLYAKWNPVSYKITYELNGGTTVKVNPSTYTIETETFTLNEPSKTGYYFDGWYTTEDLRGSKKQTVAKGSYGNLVLYAKWLKECTVTYESDYGTKPQSIKVGEGNKVTAEQLPSLEAEGKYFAGWYAGETKVEAGYTVADDVTLTAKWSDKCTVSYVTDYGITPQFFEVIKGTQLTSSNLPLLKEKGWSFKGWYTDSSYTQKVEAGYTVNSSMTLYAKWEEFTGPEDNFVFVEGGTFSMGSTSGDSDEKPVHSVTLSSFYMSPYETTQKLYKEVMGTNPSWFSSDPASGETQELRPVEKVSWYDAIYFCNKYSESEGLTPCYKVNGTTDVSSWGYTPHNENSISGTITCDFTASGYRLPTEAEWEYAARGGKNKNSYTYSGSNTISDVAWYTSNSSSMTRIVGSKTANSLGIYDMSGNVWEWCWDWYGDYSSSAQTNPTGASSGSYRVLRGGSWSDGASGCAVSCRSSGSPYYRDYNSGFRLVRSAQ